MNDNTPTPAAADWTSVQCQQGNHEQCHDRRCTCYCHTSR